MPNIRTLLGSALALCWTLSFSGLSRAQDPAQAEILFQEGRRLLDEGQVNEACDKFKDSYGADPMSGTLLNLADCHLKQGKTATAWARFRNAADLARGQGKPEQAAEASRRASELEADLSHLTVVVTRPVPGLQVKRGDVVVGPSSFGTPMPVDPGSYEIVASAPGYRTVSVNVVVGAKRDQRTVTIAELVSDTAASSTTEGQAAASAEGTPKSTPPEGRAWGSGSAVPWIVGGAGAFALVTGTVFGVLALGSNGDAEDQCPTRQNCSADALSAADRRDLQATVANIGIAAGVVGLGVAVWMLASGGSKEQRAQASEGMVGAHRQSAKAPAWTGERF